MVCVSLTNTVSDHYKYHAEYEKAGIPVYAPFLDGEPPTGMVKGIWNFTIKPFELPHGETKSYGFYITHPEIGKLLFLTDFSYCNYSFKDLKVNHILVECNWQEKYLNTEIANFDHKVMGHCSLYTATEFVRHNNSPELRSVVLLHGSSATVNPAEAVQAIKDVVDPDVAVEYAVKGLEIELKKEVL